MTDKNLLARGVCLVRLVLSCLFVCAFGGAVSFAQSGPVLLSDAASTRAIAVETITYKKEPFNVTTDLAWGADRRTRVSLIMMNLDFLAGEGVSALTADAQDASGRIYPLQVEFVSKPELLDYVQKPDGSFDLVESNQHWMHAVVLRLHDEMTNNLGDVLVRVNLHGVSSNRVRVAIGTLGGGPPDDPGAVPTAAPSTPPPPTPTPTPKQYNAGEVAQADAVRFLEQATWGPTNAEISRVQSMGIRAYLNEQLNAPSSGYPSLTFPLDDQAQGCPAGSPPECSRDNYSMYPIQKTFFTNAFGGQDQLRQRVGFALHQIFVVSGREINRPSWMTAYLQILDRNAFGNFRTLLAETTLNPGMGEYLDMRRSTLASPNENFAREILQLFSIGVNELNLDGTIKRDAQGVPIPSYDQDDVNTFTRVFTGWNFSTAIGAGVTNYRDPMVPRAGNNHDTAAKTLLNGTTLPAGQTAAQDLNAALDNIFNHPNVGPFIGKGLIQHLVTSNPTPAYVGRVAAVFNNDCAGLYPDGCTNTRGNLRSVVKAILLDPEARGDRKTDPNYGKLREPVQFMNNVLRALNVKSFDKTSTSDGVLGSRSSTDFPGAMDQPVFQPATVFSYYQPDYEVPGTKLLGPTFGILSTSTTLRRINFVNSIVYSGVAPTTTSTDRPRGTSVDLASLEALASNPDQLAGALDTLMLHGTMSASMRASIVAAVASVPTSDASFARKRAQLAAYLVATSSQYQVQR